MYELSAKNDRLKAVSYTHLTIPTVITKWLNEYRTTFLSENHIAYQYSRRKDGRRIALARRAGDSGDGGDSDIAVSYTHLPAEILSFLWTSSVKRERMRY